MIGQSPYGPPLDLSPRVIGPEGAFFPSLPISSLPGLPALDGGGMGIGASDPLLYRAINDIVAHVTVSEAHETDLIITEHPVEYGAAITDHSFVRPTQIRVQIGFTQSGGVFAPYSQAVADVREVYDKLLGLQSSRVPFSLYTGKKVYGNMLVQSIRTTTDHATEHALIADVVLQQIILVQTQTIKGVSQDPNNQADAPKTAPTSEQGTKPTTSVNVPPAQARNAVGDVSFAGQFSPSSPVGGSGQTIGPYPEWGATEKAVATIPPETVEPLPPGQAAPSVPPAEQFGPPADTPVGEPGLHPTGEITSFYGGYQKTAYPTPTDPPGDGQSASAPLPKYWLPTQRTVRAL